MSKEPVAILAAVRAALVLLVGFGVLTLTDAEVEQVAAGLGALYVALEALITAWQRSKVTPVAKAPKTVINGNAGTGSAGEVAEAVRKTKLPPSVKR